MSATNLPFIQQQMIRYGMTVYLALGLVGNICNCIVFTHRTQRRTASSVYFLSLSIFAIIFLIWAVAPLIYTLDHPDPQTQSVLYCKLRSYGAHILGQFNRYIIICACADRFFVTQTNVRIRSLSSIQMAIKLTVIVCLFWLLSAIHMPILMNIRSGICGMAGLYKFIFAIYQITLSAILPPVIMSIFSIITIRSLHQRHGAQIRARRRDRYLMRMVMAEVMVNVFTSIPFSIDLVYEAVTYSDVNKSSQRLEIESFIMFVTEFLIYLINVTPFYLYMLTSKPFRKGFVTIIVSYWKKCLVRRFRTAPLNVQNNTATNNG